MSHLWPLLGLCALLVALVGPSTLLLATLRRLLALLTWLDDVEGRNLRGGYMEGNWAPVAVEVTRAPCRVEGRVPRELVGGMYVRWVLSSTTSPTRTGANPRCWPPTNIHHAFGGEAMLHMVSVEEGEEGVEVMYTNSWIQPAQRPCSFGFGPGDILTGGFALARALVLRAMAQVAGAPVPPQERLQAGATSLVRHAGR